MRADEDEGGSMRILFVAPPLPKANTTAQPLGFGYMASVLRLNGFPDVAILDACSLIMSVEETIQAIKEHAPDVLGLTTMTVTVKNALKIAAAAKGLLPGVKVAVGGVHATVCPEWVIEDPHVDVVVRHEGEYSFLEVVQRWAAGESLDGVAGTTVKVGGQIVHHAQAPRIRNLDELPFPARELMPMHIYKANLAFPPHIRTRTTLYSARGCPYNCSFCSTAAVWGGHFCAMRSAGNVLDEIEEVIDRFGVYGFEFVDELTTLRKDRLAEFCQGIHDRGLHKVRWVCSSTVRQMDYETARMMAAAGCSMVYMGVESGSPEILKTLNKQITIDQVEEAFAATRRAGLRRSACFMIGAPGETPDTVGQTIALARRLRIERLTLNVVTPYPGTEFYEKYVDKSLELDWDQAFSSDPDKPEEATIFYNLSDMTDEELRAQWRRVRRSVELTPRNLLNARMMVNRLANRRNWRHLWNNLKGAVRIALDR
jgi:anaerobic magnesium-protoporphyrin IX monomethyl ester cyclase